MTFASPALLWSLLALLPLVAVYFLKVRPRRRPTTAYFLWRQVLSDKSPSRLWERLRNLVSLLMMAAAFAAIALAMAGPRLGDTRADDLLIVVDNSASMAAADGGAPRIEAAKSEARDLARGMNGSQRAAVATLAGRLRYASHLSDNPRELIAAIDRIQPTYEVLRPELLPTEKAEDDAAQGDASNEPADAKTNTTDSSESVPRRRIVLITDGSHEDLPEGVEPLLIGADAANIGLVGADLRFAPESPDRLLLYYQIASTHADPVQVDLVLYNQPAEGPRVLAKVIPVDAQPGVNPPRVLAVESAEPGRWVAELDTQAIAAGDSLTSDNTAYLVAYKEPPIRVRVAAGESYFFDRAVEAFSTFGGGLTPVDATAKADVVLGYGAVSSSAANTGGKRRVLFAPEGESSFWDALGEDVQVAAPRMVAQGHPILRDIDPLSIDFEGARQLSAPAGSEVLLESETGVPLLWVAKQPDAAAVVVNLDPVASEFYYSAWFPVLVRSAAKHLMGREATLAATHTPRAPVQLPLTEEQLPAMVTGPDGSTTDLSGARWAGAPTPGFYRVEAASGAAIDLGVSQLSIEETLLAPQLDTPRPAELASGVRIDHWLVVAAIVGVAAESLLYHLRKVG